MTTAKQLLEAKGHQISSVGPNDTVYDAIKKMAEDNVGSLIVVEGGKPIGIITERLYSREIAIKGLASRSTSVRTVMETNVIYVQPGQTVEECLAIMTEKRVRHLPVIENGTMMGVISIGDCVKSIIANRELTIEQLIRYIHR